MKVVYARISTPNQKTERQLQTKYKKAFIDICSGAVPFKDREQAIQLLNDDEVTEIEVKEVSRLGRNLADVLDTLETFTNKGVNIYIQNQGLSTLLPDGSTNKNAQMIISILGTIAQQERETILERTREGRELAQKRDKSLPHSERSYKGRQRGASEKLETTRKKHAKTISFAQELLDGGKSINYISNKLKEHNYKGANRVTLTRLIELGLLKKPD